MPKPVQKNEIYIGMALIGTTGILIGLVMDSPLLMVIAGFLGLVVGGFIECHHNIPLHEKENERLTKLSDLSLLCSNCHRMIHRKKKWLTIKELKELYENQ